MLFLKKTSFSLPKSRLKKADILGYFHLFIRRLHDSELVCLLSSQRIHIIRTSKTCTSKKYMCAQSWIDEKKWASYIFSRATVKAKGEQSILYLIWHLLPDFPGVASSHIQKRITTNARSMAREAVVRRHSFAQQVIRFYICAFLLSSSKRGGWMRERQSRFETPNVPIQMSFQKSQIEKKKKRGF